MPLFYSVNGALSAYEVKPTPLVIPPRPVGSPFSVFLSAEGKENAAPTVPHSVATAAYQHAVGEQTTRRQVLIAGHIMTSPAQCVSPEVSIDEAAKILHNRGFRHLPITSTDGRLNGILTDRDILNANAKRISAVSELVTGAVLSATPETPIQEIAEAFLQNRINALPIVDSDNKVIGIITTTDILNAIVQRAPLELWA